MSCPICMRRPVRPGCHTCTNSHCQEAAYYLNKAQNTRGAKAKPAAYAVAREKVQIAERSGRGEELRFDREYQQLEIVRDQAAEEAKMKAEMGG